MKTNITTENYEAYLLDYMEGNLSPDEAEQLKAFVAAQGMDWNALTEELPRLEAPQIAYEGKEKLKKKASVVPLYVKIASAAAAAGLLLTVGLWPEKQLPQQETIAALKPIEVSRIDTNEPVSLLPRRASGNMSSQPRLTRDKGSVPSEATNHGGVTSTRESSPMLAELPMKNISTLQTDLPLAEFAEPDLEFMAWRMNANLAYAPYEANAFSDENEDESDLTLIGRGILWLTNGRHNSLGSLISSGVSKAKEDLTEVATDMAWAAYNNVSEQIEETKERWEEKLGE